MLRRIAIREVLDAWRDRQALWAGAALLILAAVSGVAMRGESERRTRDHADARRQMREEWLQQGQKDPHQAAHYGVFALRPLTVPARLDPGVEPFAGTAIFLEAHRQNAAQYASAADRPLLQRFGDLSLANALFVFVPLAVILLAHAVVCGERRDGTLALALAQGVPRHVWLGGKMLGTAVVIGGVAVPAIALGVGLAVPASSHLEAGASGRVIALGAVFAAYTALWILGTVAVSAWARRAATALSILLACWIAGTLVLPRVVSGLAERLHPTPGAVELASAADAERTTAVGSGGLTPTQAYEASVVQQYGVRYAKDLPVNLRGLQLQRAEEQANAVWDRHIGGLWDTYARQQAVRQWLSLVVPTMAARDLAMAAAATSLQHQRSFVEEAEQYRRDLVRSMNLAIAYNSRTGEQYQAGPELWQSIPEFAPIARSLWWSIAREWPALLSLAIWMVALVGIVCRTRLSSLDVS